MATLHYLNQHWIAQNNSPNEKQYDVPHEKHHVSYTELSLHHLPTPSELQSGYTTDDSVNSQDGHSTPQTPSSTCSSDVMRTEFESWKLNDASTLQHHYPSKQQLTVHTNAEAVSDQDSPLESPASVELNDHQVQAMLHPAHDFHPYSQHCFASHSSGHRRISSPTSFVFSPEDIDESNNAAPQYKDPKHYTTYPVAPVQLSLPVAVRQRLQKRCYGDVAGSVAYDYQQQIWHKAAETTDRYQPEKYMVRDDHSRHSTYAGYPSATQYEASHSSLPAASHSTTSTLPALVNTYHYASRQHHRAQSANTQQPRHPMPTLQHRAQTAHVYHPSQYTSQAIMQYPAAAHQPVQRQHLQPTAQRAGLTRSQPLQSLNHHMYTSPYQPQPPSQPSQQQRAAVTARRTTHSTRVHPMY